MKIRLTGAQWKQVRDWYNETLQEFGGVGGKSAMILNSELGQFEEMNEDE